MWLLILVTGSCDSVLMRLNKHRNLTKEDAQKTGHQIAEKNGWGFVSVRWED